MADAGPDDLPAAPPGVSGPSNTIAGTVEAAMAAGMANVMYLEHTTAAAGDSTGDVMPMPLPPDRDTSILGGDPEAVSGVPHADPQGHGMGDNG